LPSNLEKVLDVLIGRILEFNNYTIIQNLNQKFCDQIKTKAFKHLKTFKASVLNKCQRKIHLYGATANDSFMLSMSFIFVTFEDNLFA
jgi:hypothetical protein